jgi:hypothetical protein
MEKNDKEMMQQQKTSKRLPNNSKIARIVPTFFNPG